MGQVTVTINGRGYTVGCDDGQEDHIVELANYLNHHMDQLQDSVGSVGDMRLMLLAGLMVADELSETLARLDSIEAELTELREQQQAATDQAKSFEQSAAEAVNSIAARIEAIAGRLAAT